MNRCECFCACVQHAHTQYDCIYVCVCGCTAFGIKNTNFGTSKKTEEQTAAYKKEKEIFSHSTAVPITRGNSKNSV